MSQTTLPQNDDFLVQALSKYMRPGAGGPNGYNVPFHCPFHASGAESTASFYTYIGPAEDGKFPGSSFCHTCDRGWNLFTLLKELGAPSAIIRQLCDINDLYREDGKKRKKQKTVLDADLRPIPETFLAIYDYKPLALAEQFANKTLRDYEIGFDREYQRITFPIRDHHGRLVGISGRSTGVGGSRYKIYKQEIAKYVPGYELDKSKVLWGAHLLYQTYMNGSATRLPVAVCEGFKACMWVRQCGYENVVCMMGTYLSPFQLVLLERLANDVVLFLDNDPPGKRAVRKLLSRDYGFSVRVADYQGLDVSPDDLSEETTVHAVTKPLTPRQWRAIDGNTPPGSSQYARVG